MPGGSVNGRPFRESSDSYARTGIPCGNPRRYQSHEVVRMEPATRSKSKPIDGPLEAIETEGQKQLQALLHRQMETKVTVKQQLGQKREFSRGSEYHSSLDILTGTQSLADFKMQGDVDSYIEEMKSFGLSHEDILFKMQMENQDSLAKKGKLANAECDKIRLKEIEDKIAEKKSSLAKPDQFSNLNPISRHEMELENAIANANPNNRFLHKTLVREKTHGDNVHSNDPMNNLPDILENITKNKTSGANHRQKKKKDKSYKNNCQLECCITREIASCTRCENVACRNQNEAMSSCDQTCDHCSESCDHQQVATCAEKPSDYISPGNETDNEIKISKKPEKSTAFSVQNSKSADENKMSQIIQNKETLERVRLLDNVAGIPEESIRQYKMSSEEIKKIPRFESYTPGEPSNVLFVKNLSPKVTEEDLATLFINFQENDTNMIVFKLCTGRMKGQAFVTFTDVQTATAALHLVHGYEFKGKPVIIQYGKKSQ